MHNSITLQGRDVAHVPVLQAAALPKLDAGFGFLSAPVVEQAPVAQAPVMGSLAQPAQPAIVAAEDTQQASPASRQALPGAPAEPADPQHSPSGLRTAVPEAAVGSKVPALAPARVDHNGAPAEEPAWMPLVVDFGGVQHSQANPGSCAGSEQAALLRSQVRVCIPQRRRSLALQRQQRVSVRSQVQCFAVEREEAPPGNASAPRSCQSRHIRLLVLQHGLLLTFQWLLMPDVMAVRSCRGCSSAARQRWTG